MSAAINKYLCSDRLVDGYRGRWRYRVTELRANGSIGFRVLFRTRRDASSFSANCSAFGVQRAAQLLEAGGFRDGVGLKFEPACGSEPFATMRQSVDDGPGRPPNPSTVEKQA